MKMLPGVGVFGTGSSARVLVPLLRAEGFTVEALWGKTEEEAKQLAEEMNITFYTSQTDDVLLHQDVDLVCINIPPPLTRQISVKALGIGKNVVCEKAATSVDAFRMVTASRYYPQLMSLVGNVLRFLPAFVRMKQLIAEHYVGAVMICDARIYSGSLLSPNYGWICDELMGGGGLHTMGTYIVDLLTHLTGRRAEKVHGLLKTFVRQNAAICGIRHVTSDDFCFFQMLMSGGVCSTVTLNFNMPGTFVHEVMVVGSAGRLVARGADLYGQKNTATQEELLLRDSLAVGAGLPEQGPSKGRETAAHGTTPLSPWPPHLRMGFRTSQEWLGQQSHPSGIHTCPPSVCPSSLQAASSLAHRRGPSLGELSGAVNLRPRIPDLQRGDKGEPWNI
uniref:Glucose-fructose oxidoreductase domain-containing protein 2 n=1 Tax=Rousettus aegyptiacus TaxID=9407 RepID=A0A7J8CGE2_ROUAE|nr:glucose-fructose oxidoreductase domain containing 2 [Rousettus aegyptiacus]